MLLRTRVGLPHARGGVSEHGTKTFLNGSSSPRTWGCFPIGIRLDLIKGVFPTHVGVFPLLWHRRRREEGLPHARGGVSGGKGITQDAIASSPRTWGCFHGRHAFLLQDRVFPTHVGVFPRKHGSCSWPERLPHARGGVSGGVHFVEGVQQSSPHTWGVRQIREVRVQSFCAHTRKIPCEGNLHRGSIFTGCGERI